MRFPRIILLLNSFVLKRKNTLVDQGDLVRKLLG